MLQKYSESIELGTESDSANALQPYSLYDVVLANVLVRRPVIQICLSVSCDVQLGPQS